MNRIHLSHYRLPAPAPSSSSTSPAPLRVFVLSDVHFSYQVKPAKLAALQRFVQSQSPDYIFIPGDLIDSNDMVDDPAEQARLLEFVGALGRIAPTLISLGNHDFYRYPTSAKKSAGLTHDWEIAKNPVFRSALASLKNVHLLDDATFEDDRIFVLGLTQTPAYYNFQTEGKKRTSVLRPSHELPSELVRILDALPASSLKNLPADKLKFALVHSPVCLKEKTVATRLAEFDFTVSGHMHNGVVPPVLNELWRSDRGLISPTRNLFPPLARGTAKLAAPSHHSASATGLAAPGTIITGAVTTFHECAGPLHHLNFLYPTYVTLLEFDPEQPKEPTLRRKYIKPKQV